MTEKIDVYTHDGADYDLTKTRILMRDKKTFFLSINELTWVFKHDTPDPHRVLHAKIRWPLLVARYRGKWVVVDGLHRLKRYQNSGIKAIPVKHVTNDILAKVKL